MRKLSNWFFRVSKGWVVLAALAIFVLFIVLVLPGQSNRADADSAEAGTPDLSLIYSPDDLFRMAEAYGADGRQEYIRIRFSFDLIWPFVYSFFLVTATSWVFAKAFAPGSRWRWANLVPVAAMFLDYLENLSTSLVMLRYPSHTPLIELLAPLFTFSKWATLGGSFVLLLVGTIVWVWHLLERRK